MRIGAKVASIDLRGQSPSDNARIRLLPTQKAVVRGEDCLADQLLGTHRIVDEYTGHRKESWPVAIEQGVRRPPYNTHAALPLFPLCIRVYEGKSDLSALDFEHGFATWTCAHDMHGDVLLAEALAGLKSADS